jgi:hypothetical protein
MSYETAIQHNEEEVLRYNFSDEEVEAAGSAAGLLTYTYQTSAYNRCCR